MKNKHIYTVVLSVIFCLLLPYVASAYAGETSWNPIYVEIRETPAQQLQRKLEQDSLLRQQNNILAQTMKSACGGYYGECYSQYCSGLDTANPRVQSGCMIAIPPCCERNIWRQKAMEEQQKLAKEQLEKQRLVSLTPDQRCARDLGTGYKFSGKYSEDGKLICDCVCGYTMLNGDCVVKPEKTPDQVCRDKYGEYSYYTNKLEEGTGKYLCDCIQGYQWGGDGSECVVVEQKPQMSPDQICVRDYGMEYKYAGNYDINGNPNCDCVKGYKADGTGLCVKQEIKPLKELKPIIKQNTNPNVPVKAVVVNKPTQNITHSTSSIDNNNISNESNNISSAYSGKSSVLETDAPLSPWKKLRLWLKKFIKQ